MKKKAYILAFQKATNYGAVLQIYALKTILEKLGVYVEVIDYVPKWMKVTFKNQPNIKSYIKRKIMNVTFKRFFQKLNLTETYYKNEILKESLQDGEYYFVGSDQVWNQKIIKNDLTYFLNFAPENSKKIGYAISMGNNYFSKEFEKQVIPYIKRFDFLSARESFVSKYVRKKIPNCEVPTVLDPTLLLNESDYNKIKKDKNYKKEYIVLYAAMYDDNLFKLANYLKKKTGLPLINLGYHFKGADKQEYIFGPEYFLNRISQASFVITNSFHGTVFSIIFKRIFFTVPNLNPSQSGLNARFVSLLNYLDLSNRLVTSNKDIDILMSQSINFNEAFSLLNIKRKKSINFIKNAIGLSND